MDLSQYKNTDDLPTEAPSKAKAENPAYFKHLKNVQHAPSENMFREAISLNQKENGFIDDVDFNKRHGADARPLTHTYTRAAGYRGIERLTPEVLKALEKGTEHFFIADNKNIIIAEATVQNDNDGNLILESISTYCNYFRAPNNKSRLGYDKALTYKIMEYAMTANKPIIIPVICDINFGMSWFPKMHHEYFSGLIVSYNKFRGAVFDGEEPYSTTNLEDESQRIYHATISKLNF